MKSLNAALLKKAAANSKPKIVKVLVNTDIIWGAFLFTLPIEPPIVTLSEEVAAKLKIKTIKKNKYTMGCFKVYLSSDFKNDLNIQILFLDNFEKNTSSRVGSIFLNVLSTFSANT